MKKNTSLKRLYEGSKRGIATHLSDSTALMAASTPAFAAFETFMAGMPYEKSVHARSLAVGLTFAGMGRLFTATFNVVGEVAGQRVTGSVYPAEIVCAPAVLQVTVAVLLVAVPPEVMVPPDEIAQR